VSLQGKAGLEQTGAQAVSDETFAQRTNKQLQREFDEFHNDPVRSGQQQLDVW
jgi:hypothetical protein